MTVSISRLVFNPFSVNTYILWNESKEVIIVDPGCSDSNEQNLLEELLRKNDLKPKYLINTHCHIDHILGNAYLKEKYKVQFIAPEKDKFLLEMMMEQGSMFGLNVTKSPEPDLSLSEDLELDISFKVKFLFTPGHTPGEFCIYVPEGKFCITGDVLFKEGIGRTDLWGGSYSIIMNSINKLMQLPDDTIIYPGHGEESTIGYERTHNPYF